MEIGDKRGSRNPFVEKQRLFRLARWVIVWNNRTDINWKNAFLHENKASVGMLEFILMTPFAEESIISVF